MSCNWLAWSALALFALSFVSASDGLGLDKLLRGYLRQYRIHHRIAMLAVLLVVAHISHEFASLPATDRSMLLDLQDRAMLLAWLAVLLLLALTLAAIVRQHWRRRYWLRLHWLLLPAMLLALAHAWLSTRPALRAMTGRTGRHARRHGVGLQDRRVGLLRQRGRGHKHNSRRGQGPWDRPKPQQ